VSLPPPEKLKYKILIKDKLIRKKGESSAAFGTLPRGASINLDSIEEEGPADKKKAGEGGPESPLPALSGKGTFKSGFAEAKKKLLSRLGILHLGS